ncbi:unnamed protein product [Rhizopus stolonifer]
MFILNHFLVSLLLGKRQSRCKSLAIKHPFFFSLLSFSVNRMIPINNPATCELCGEWMPKHAPACPRNGVHPSQWSTELDITINILLFHIVYHIPNFNVQNKQLMYLYQ